MRLQAFFGDTFDFRVLVVPIATFNFQPLPLQPVISIVPGPPERHVAVIQTLRRPGEAVSPRLKAEDKWGNPSDQWDILFFVEPEGEIDGLPDKVRMSMGDLAAEIDGLTANGPGIVSIRLFDAEGDVMAVSM